MAVACCRISKAIVTEKPCKRSVRHSGWCQEPVAAIVVAVVAVVAVVVAVVAVAVVVAVVAVVFLLLPYQR